MSSVATMQPAAAVFHEEQYFDWKVYALIGTLEILCGLAILWWTHRADVGGLIAHAWSLEFGLGLFAGLGLPFLLIVSVLHMTTEATADLVTVWYGWVPIYRRTISVAEIKSCDVVTYRPLLDYGGWGCRRRADGDRAFTARGDRGVRLTLPDGTHLLIGSQRPDELADALARPPRPDAA